MSRMIQCTKLQQQAEGLDALTYPGELGQRIYREISKQAWQRWIEHQTMLINEYRLSMLDTNARKFLAEEMEKFLFGDGSSKPQGYVAPEK